MPLSLDEVVNPVTIINDASRVPYASEPRECMAWVSSLSSIAPNFPACTLWNHTGNDPNDQQAVVGVMRDVLWCSTQAPAAARIDVFLARNTTPGDIATLTPSAVLNDDHATTSTNPQGARIGVYSDQAQGFIGREIFSMLIPAALQPYRIPLDFVCLYSGDSIRIARDASTPATTDLFVVRWQEYTLRAG